MTETQDYRTVEGMEDMEVAVPRLAYVRLLNGSAAEKVDLPAGTIVLGSKDNLEVLANKGEPFKFIPIKYYTDWSVWDNKTRTLIKRTFDKRVWSDGSKVTMEEVGTPTGAWYNAKAPTATEGMNFIILPLSELEKEEPKYMVLQLAIRNKFISKTANALKKLLQVKVIEEQCSGMYNLIISLQSTKIEDKDNLWYEWTEPTYIDKIDAKYLDIAKTAYSETKDINKTGTALIPIESSEPEVVYTVPEGVQESTEF